MVAGVRAVQRDLPAYGSGQGETVGVANAGRPALDRLLSEHTGSTPLSRGGSKVDGGVREVSVLMADLRGYTTFCESVTPSRIAGILNDYLAAMAEVIVGKRGLVQDFVGDGVLGIFGASGNDPDHAWHAASGALQIQSATQQLGARWMRKMNTRFAVGVAVHSGDAFVGAVGPPRQRKHAVVGDTVNTAARLEELNRRLGTRVLMTSNTLDR